MDDINLFIQFAKVDDLRSYDIMSQHVWDNACILGQNSTIYDPYLSSKGIKTLKDVIDGDGNICLTNIHSNSCLYLPDLSDENVHLGFNSNNSSMRLENHILPDFKRFLFEN